MWLAIDPSLRNTGWAVMDETTIYDIGLIRTERDKNYPMYQDNASCCQDMAAGLDEATEILDGHGGGPMYAEAKGGSKSARAAAAMAMAQGVLASASMLKGKGLTLMLPQEVKKRLCGDRKASKDDVRAAVNELYPGLWPKLILHGYRAKKYNEHIYDAIAIGWAINQRNKEQG